MKMRPINLRITAWLTCLALLVMSMAPVFSHSFAMTGANPGFSSEICTAYGLKRVNASSEAGIGFPSSDQGGTHFEHCSFCFTHGGPLGSPYTGSLPIVVLNGAAILPALFYQARRPLQAWATAQSRAPPAFLQFLLIFHLRF